MAINITAAQQTQISQLYVAFFNRAADSEGLGHWANALANGRSIEAIAQDFYNTAPARAYYSTALSNEQYIKAFYATVLNRSTPDAEGVAYWTALLNQPGSTQGSVAVAIISAVQTYNGVLPEAVAAKAMFDARVSVSTSYALANGTIANATSVLAGVVDAATAATAKAGLGATPGSTFTLTTGVDSIVGTAGNDTLTALIDYTAVDGSAPAVQNSTLTALDVIDGGAGADVLNINALTVVAELAAVTVTNVETLNVRAAKAFTADVSGFTGLTNANVTQAAEALNLTAAATTAVNVSGATAAVTVIGGSTQTVNVEQGNAITLTKGTNVSVTATKVGNDTDTDGGAIGTANTDTDTDGTMAITVGDATVANQPTGTVTIQSAGKSFADAASATLGAITVNGGTVVSINQDAYSDVTGASTSIAAAKIITQSAVTVNGGANTTTVIVTQDAAATGTPATIAVAGSTETASVVFSTMASGKTLVTNGLTFTALKDLTAAEVATAFANLTAADTMGSAGSINGTYSGTLSGWTSGAATGNSVTFTSTTATAPVAVDLVFTGTAKSAVAPVVTTAQGENNVTGVTGVAGVIGGKVVVDGAITGTDKITTVTLDGYGAASTVASDALTTLSLANSAQSITVTNATAASTLGLTLNKVGTVEVKAATTPVVIAAVAEAAAAVSLDGSPGKYTTLNVTTTGADSVVDLTAAGVKTLNVAGTNAVKITSDLGALETVVVSGSAGVDLSASTGSTLVSINTTATTGTVTSTLDIATAYAGGAGVDKVTVAALNTKALTLGDGNDTAIMSDKVGAGGSVDAGAGTADVLSMTAANAALLSADVVFEAGISNFEVLTLSDSNSADGAKVNLANLDDINIVKSAGASQTMLIENFGANGSLTLTGALTAASEAKLAVSTGTADVFNITVSGDASIDNTAALTVAGVETINITSTDSVTTDTVKPAHTLTLIDTKATTINVTGNAALNLTNDATNVAVTLIDGSTMTAALTAATTNTTAAETIKGGAGNDVLTSTGDFANVLVGGAGNDTLKSGAGMDTLTGGDGADVFVIDAASLNVNSYTTITDFVSGTDEIRFVDADKFVASKVTLGVTAVFQDYANAAMKAAGLNDMTWFQYGGDTYILMDAVSGSTTFVNGTDKIVKITGLVDLSLMPFTDTTGFKGIVAATLLNDADSASTTAVNALFVTEITGAAADVVDAANDQTTIDTAVDVKLTVNSGTATVAQANLLKSYTTGVVTATATETDAATLKTLTTANTDMITTTLAAVSTAAADLTAIDGKTGVAVVATAVTEITGLLTDVNIAIASTGITKAAAYGVTLSDTTATLAALKTLETTAAVTLLTDASTVTSTDGSVADAKQILVTDAGTTGDTIKMNAAVVVTLSDATGTLASADLAAVGGATTGAVTVANSQTITGAAADVIAALATAGSKVDMAVNKVATVDLDAAQSFTAAELTSVYGAVGGTVIGTAADTITVTTLAGATVAATESVDTFVFGATDMNVAITGFTFGAGADVLNVSAFTGAIDAAGGGTGAGTSLGLSIADFLDFSANPVNVIQLNDIQTLVALNFGGTASGTVIQTAISSSYFVAADVAGDLDAIQNLYYVSTGALNVATVALVGTMNEGTLIAANLA